MLKLEPISSKEDGGTGHRWIASWVGPSENIQFDSSGVTIEEALVSLINELGNEVDNM